MRRLDARLAKLEAAAAPQPPAGPGYIVFADEAALAAYRAQLGPGRSRERITAFLAIASPDTWDEVDNDETT